MSTRSLPFPSLIPQGLCRVAKGDAVHTIWGAAKEPQCRREALAAAVVQNHKLEVGQVTLESKTHRRDGEGNAPDSLEMKNHIVSPADQPHLSLKGTVFPLSY